MIDVSQQERRLVSLGAGESIDDPSFESDAEIGVLHVMVVRAPWLPEAKWPA